MSQPIISAIAAIGAHNRELGGGNKILWHIPKDQQWYEEKTRGHVIIMGRKTFEQINKKPQPNRINIVISSQEILGEGFIFVKTIAEALEKGRELEQNGEIFIVGGGQIYTLAMSFIERLYVTLIDGEFAEADAFFPDFSYFNKLVYQKTEDETETGGFIYSFNILEKS
jgi:dihydrofolate reductase